MHVIDDTRQGFHAICLVSGILASQKLAALHVVFYCPRHRGFPLSVGHIPLPGRPTIFVVSIR